MAKSTKRIQEVVVPNLDGAENVPIVDVFVAPGDVVKKEESLFSVESEKAVMDIPAPFAGTVETLKIKSGDEVSAGDVVALFQVSDEVGGAGDDVETDSAASAPESKTDAAEGASVETDEAQKTHLPKNGVTPVVAVPSVAQASPGGGHASPAVRKFARELGANLSMIAGTGPKGRIRKSDVQQWVKIRLTSEGAASGSNLSTLSPVTLEDFTSWGPVETLPLTPIQKRSGELLQGGWQTKPLVTQFDKADITEMEDYRKTQNARLKSEGIKLTPLAFVIKATVKALEAFPRFNASLDVNTGQLFVKGYYNIGFAVDTPSGLVVPVLKRANEKGILDIAKEIVEIGERARRGQATREDFAGGTFTISSLGGIGGTGFTPLIKHPEAAILGLSRAEMQPVWSEQKRDFVPRRVLPFSLSYDHMIVDGAQGARFCRFLGGLLEDLRNMLL